MRRDAGTEFSPITDKPFTLEPPQEEHATLSAMLSRRQQMLTGVEQLVRQQLAPLVQKIDQEAFYPRDILQGLGHEGAYQCMLGPAADYALAIEAMAKVSETCLSTGFLMWCQDVCGLYIEQSGNTALIERRLAAHAEGRSLGGTGMSNPMKTLANIETLLLKGKRVRGGYQVNGVLPWVSNIGAGHYLGAVFQVDGKDEKRDAHEVMFMLECDAPGVTLNHCPTFSGMEGTQTFSVRLRDHFVGDDCIIADPMRPFIARIRAAFILLQCGMGLGLSQGAIDSCISVERQLGHVNTFLDDRPDDLQAELDQLSDRVMQLSANPFDGSQDHLVAVMRARAECSEISLKSAQSALLHQGARGYLMTAAPQRRVREAHFVAIVTPALKHLRKEIHRLTQSQPLAH